MKRSALVCLFFVLLIGLFAASAAADGDKIVRITNYRSVNVRNGPDAGYKAIGSAEPDDTFPYLGTKDNWHRIQYEDGVEGYVSGKLSVVEDAPERWSAVPKLSDKPELKAQTDVKPEPNRIPAAQVSMGAGLSSDLIVRITHTRTVNVRTGPGTGYEAIGSVKPESEFAYLGTENGWHCIQYDYGEKGYVSAKLSAVEAAPDKKKFARITNYRSVNVRTGPGTEYEAIGSVKPEETFSYLGSENGWHCIEYDGMMGYVSGNMASLEFEGHPLKKKVTTAESGGSDSSGSSSGSGGHWEWQWKWRWEWRYDSNGRPYQVQTNSPVQVWVND